MMKRFVALLALAILSAVAAGCYTVEGIGKDVKAAGGGIEKAAEKTKPY